MILLLLSLAWLAGVVAAALGLASLWPLLALAAAGVCCGLVVSQRVRVAVAVALLTTIALVAAQRYEAARPVEGPTGIGAFNGETVQLRGTVVSQPEERDRSQRFTLRAEAVSVDGAWQSTSGGVLVTTRLFPRLRYGDELELRAKLEDPPRFDGFDYREYLARRGTVSLSAFPQVRRVGTGGGSAVLRAVDQLRRPLDESLQRTLPEPASALARGILLGQRASIPRDLTDDFNRSGISHLIAISGYNVLLVAGFSVGALSWAVGRRPATFAAMLIVVLFAAFVGASPSVLRAAVMGEIMLGASLAGRPGSALTAVVFTGAVLTAWQPSIIDDVAFQLSFAATLGIILLSRRLQERLDAVFARLPDAARSLLVEPLAVTTAASLAVLPIIGASFGRLSLVALPANLLAVPAFPVILAASALTAVTGAVSTDLGLLLAHVTVLPLSYLIWLGRTLASLPFASVNLQGAGTTEALVAYVAIGAVSMLVVRRRPTPADEPRVPLRLRPALAVALVLALVAVVVWARVLSSGPSELTVTVLDVGQGDAILIETPAGQRILVDGGPSGQRLVQSLGRELPASARRLDLVVLTHGQDDHVTGLVTALERYDVTEALAGPLPGETAAYRAWRDTLTSRRVPVERATAGETADLGRGVRLEVLGPPERPVVGGSDPLNNNSVVLRLVFRDVSFLLTGDLAAEGEAALLAGGGSLRSTVLKLGHHGSDGSTTPAFLAAVQPRLGVISVGAENTYGHPSPTTLLRLTDLPLLRTDENGRVRLRTDGRDLRIDYDRGGFRNLGVRPGR